MNSNDVYVKEFFERFELNDVAPVLFERTCGKNFLEQFSNLDESVVIDGKIIQRLLSHFFLSYNSPIEIMLNVSQYDRREIKIEKLISLNCDFERLREVMMARFFYSAIIQ